MFEIRDVVIELTTELQTHPEDFELSFSKYTLVHIPTNIEIWIANGIHLYLYSSSQ